MSRVAPRHFFKMEREQCDRLDCRLDDDGELMSGSLSQMAASGAVVGILMVGLRRFAFRRRSLLIVV